MKIQSLARYLNTGEHNLSTNSPNSSPYVGNKVRSLTPGRMPPSSLATRGKETDQTMITAPASPFLMLQDPVMLHRLLHHLTDRVLSESQAGFRQQCSTVDTIFVAWQLLEKAREHQKEISFAFIDLCKVYGELEEGSRRPGGPKKRYAQEIPQDLLHSTL